MFQDYPLSFCFLLTKHSPLTPVFKIGFSKIWENGLYRQILLEWLGSDSLMKNEDPFSTVKLGLGQVRNY